MKNLHKIFIITLLFVVASCTEDIIIDVVEGEPMIGVEASFTDELKHHEAILSYSTDLYNKEDIRMVSGALVYVTDGVDTVYYREDAEMKGHYFTALVAGRKNTLYRFCADIPDEHEEDGCLHLYAESKMTDNVDVIDSLVLKPFNGEDTIPVVFFGDTIEWLYPYFQSLPDPTVTYMPLVYQNDTLLNDTLTQRMIIPVGGYAGFYINGPEMQAANKEIPIHYFSKKTLKEGDRIRAELYSIPTEYLYYYYSIIMSNGSNPMMGAPSNVDSNVHPSERGMGWFLTASVVSAETVFRDKCLNQIH